jgi:dihydroxy-acid dehydratase
MFTIFPKYINKPLGMSLQGCVTALAVSAKGKRIAYESGVKIVEFIKEDLKPCDILTLDSFKNTITNDMALGDFTNTVLHLPVIANEGGIAILKGNIPPK